MADLTGKVALITGGGRGQGRSHAIHLARAGADIAICDIDFQYDTIPYSMSVNRSLEETKALVEAEGRKCFAMNADVRDPAQIRDWVKQSVEALGGPDILVAQAGVWAPAPLVDTSDELWRDTIDTDLGGVFFAMREVAPLMIERGGGRIVATSSMCARQGTPNLIAYGAAKWGILGLVKTAALELGAHHITVNAINPSFVATDMLNFKEYNEMFRPDLENPSRETSDEVIMNGHHFIPVGSFDAEEISKALLFLVSDDASLISGTALDVNAGKSGLWAV